MKRVLAMAATFLASLILVGGSLSLAQTPVTVTLYPSQQTLILPNTPTSFVQVDLPFGTYDISAIFQGAHAGGDLDHVFLYAPTGETTPQFPRGHAMYESIGGETKRITFPTPSGLSYISIYLFFVDLGDLGDNPGFATVKFVKVPSSGSNDVVSVNVYPSQHTIILPSAPTNYLRVDLPFGTYRANATFNGAHAGGDIDHVFLYGPTGETTPQWPRGHAIHDVIGVDQKLYTFPVPSGLPYMSVYLFFADLGNLGDNPGSVTVTFAPVTLPPNNEPPRITSFSPKSATTGTTLQIHGTNFGSSPQDNIVFFGAVKAQVVQASSELLTVLAPSEATFAPITVTVNGLTAFSPLPFTPLSPINGPISQTSFASGVVFPVGNEPEEFAYVDLDGDGKADLTVGNAGGGSWSVLQNQATVGPIASNSFAPHLVGAPAENPYGTSVSDLDGDGKPDVIMVNGNSSSVSVFRNISVPGTLTAGSFAPRQNFSIPYNSRYSVVQDLDMDGRPDVMLVNAGGSTISILRNTSTMGSISFAAATGFGVGKYPTSLAVGDLDGDGKPDVVVVNNGDHSFSALRNISTPGSLAFEPKVDFSAYAAISAAVADFDGDGKLDVAVKGYEVISVFRNVSSPGSFNSNTFAPKQDFPFGAGDGYSLAVGDLNGDAKPDLVTPKFHANAVSVLANSSVNGTISFEPKVEFPCGVHPHGIGIGDVDGDGRPEILVSVYGANNITVLQNLVQPANRPPVADPGRYEPVECTSCCATTVPLNGTGSSDPDGDILTYTWTGPFGTANQATPKVLLPLGENIITLTVSDGKGGTSSTQVKIYVVDTTPPTLTVPASITAYTGTGATTCSAVVTDAQLGQATASDKCSATVTLVREGMPAQNDFPIGKTTIQYTATDAQGNKTSATQDVSVVDNTPPTITCPQSILVTIPSNGTSKVVTWDPPVASDNCSVTVTCSPASGYAFPPGTTTVTCTAKDPAGNTASCTFTVAVNRAPDCTARPSIAQLWPANHKMVKVTIAGATDPDGDPVAITITAITQDEPTNGLGDGDISPDGAIVGTSVAQVRAERAGTPKVPGNGRVYRISYTASDGRGGTCEGSVSVCVPRDQDKRSVCIDDGQRFNSITGATVLASTGSSGFSIEAIAAEEAPAYAPDSYALLNAYPNPFNPTTTIQYDVPELTHVRLAVFDVLGQEVALLVDGERGPGRYSYTFDASALKSGTYFYRIETEKFKLTKRFVLLK